MPMIGTVLRCSCGKLCLVAVDGLAHCSNCQTVYRVTVQIEHEGRGAPGGRRTAEAARTA